MHGAPGRAADLNDASVARVRGNYGGLGPIEIPSVFDGQNRVRTRNHIEQTEGAVEVALIAAEKVAVVLQIFRDQDDHGSGEGFVPAFRRAFHV